MTEIDTRRVLCKLNDIADGDSKGFSMGEGEWPLRGMLVRLGEDVHAYVNYCPHAGHPLNFMPDRFLTPDKRLILCLSHGAMFEKATGFCVMGPCAGKSLCRVPIVIEAGIVMLAAEADVGKLAPRYW
ncbi:MAG: Rieske 2Fe-2S domain-containing protein [Steroidobacteraceae bacterium]